MQWRESARWVNLGEAWRILSDGHPLQAAQRNAMAGVGQVSESEGKHDVFCQMDTLYKQHNEMQWRESARWVNISKLKLLRSWLGNQRRNVTCSVRWTLSTGSTTKCNGGSLPGEWIWGKHDVFCQMDTLYKQHNEMQWRESARWVNQRRNMKCSVRWTPSTSSTMKCNGGSRPGEWIWGETRRILSDGHPLQAAQWNAMAGVGQVSESEEKHDVFCQMDTLYKQHNEMQWRESAR